MAERLINGFAGRETVLPANIDMLSNRELEVLYFIGQGLPTSTIATRLHLSIKTVNTHRGNLKRKLRLANGGELLSYAVQWHMEQAQGRPAPLPTGGHGPG
jgi:DNA-binding CsgD family transcriptional regulator